MKSFAGAYVNLLKTSIGSGVLSFPYLFKTYGIIPSILLTVFTGSMATTGLLLLTLCSQGIGRSADLSKLAAQSFPHARIFVDLAVFLKCFGVSLSYVIITRQILPSVLSSVIKGSSLSFFSHPPVSLFIFLGAIGPFAYFTKLDRLKYTSFVGVFSILLVTMAAVARYSTTPTTATILFFNAPSIAWLSGLGKFVFSFTCHQNIFSVNAELEDNSLKNMKRLVLSVSLSSFSLYMAFGIFNYMIYGDLVAVNILKSYPDDAMAIFVRGLYVIVMGVSYPLQMAPARTYLLNMLGVVSTTKRFKIVQFLATTFLIAATYTIAVMGVELGVVYSIIGATASCFMCLILPPLFYFNLGVRKTVLMSISAYFSFILGVFIFGATMIALLYNGIH